MEKLPTSSKALRYLPFLVASAFFMQMLDATILNTAIPTIARSFNSHPLQLHSLVTAYMLTVCVLIPASGWISDKLGSRRTFLLAISIFSVGSLLCALSASITMMTVCRVIQGIGGAFLMPVGRLVVLRSYPRSMFVNVLNIVTIPALLGPLLGPVLGGIIVQYASWHWIFLINIPVGMAGLWATWKLMPDLKAVRAWSSSRLPEAFFNFCTGFWRSVQKPPSSARPCSASETLPSESPATSSAAWAEAACRT